MKRIEEAVTARAKTVDEIITEFKRLKDSTSEATEQALYDAGVVEDKN